MPDSSFLTLADVSHMLKIGESTLNVWLNRYKEWMPPSLDEQRRYYPKKILELFRFISKCTHVGMEYHDIARVLESKEKADEPIPKAEPIRENNSPQADSTVLLALKDLMSGMVAQQARIADAQERRAAAEERKAYALESQAENELIKAGMLREIVSVLQDMSVKNTVSSLMDRVKGGHEITYGEVEPFPGELEFAPESLEDIPELVESPEEPVDLEELEELYPEPLTPAADDVIDLAAPLDVDDLSQLLEDGDGVSETDIDDLSALLEPHDLASNQDIDDLSMLLDDDEKGSHDSHDSIDDLSLLIDDEIPEATPERKPEKPASPAPVDENYKSIILKRIIRMKQKDGLSVEETTRRFNEEGVQTFSGKGEWSIKTIQGIYKYIDSVGK